MITIFFHMTAKAGREQEFHDLLVRMTAVTRAEDEGCVSYTFHQQADKPGAYVLYEQWRDQAAIEAHLANMQKLLGPPAPGSASRFPALLQELTDKAYPVFYNVVA